MKWISKSMPSIDYSKYYIIYNSETDYTLKVLDKKTEEHQEITFPKSDVETLIKLLGEL